MFRIDGKFYSKVLSYLVCKMYRYLIVSNQRLNQYTTYNCFDTYSTVINEKQDENELSQEGKDFIEALRYFEKLHHRYKASKH